MAFVERSPWKGRSRQREVRRMDACLGHFRNLVRDEYGATATEYAVMLALILVAVLGSVGTMGLTVASKLAIPGW